MRCEGERVLFGVTCASAADLAARGEKVWEQEVKVEKVGVKRDVVATMRLPNAALVTREFVLRMERLVHLK